MLFNIWVTSTCNFRCKYCYVSDYEENMDTRTAKTIISFIKNIKKDNDDEIIINFHGGEPLLNFELIEKMILDLERCIQNHKLLFGITTNGSLLTESISNFLVSKFHYNLSISLDGTKKTNDLNRVYANKLGTYDRVIDNFLYLKSLDPYVRVRMTYNHETVGFLSENIQHIIKLGFRKIVAIPDFSDKKWNDINTTELERELAQIFALYYDNKSVDINILSDDIRRSKQECHGGEHSFNIYIDGTIFPCTWTVGNKEFVIGNIYNGLNHKKVNEILEYSQTPIKECDGCSLYNACIGNRCRIINKLITDDYCKIPILRCEYNNILYKLQKQYRDKGEKTYDKGNF